MKRLLHNQSWDMIREHRDSKRLRDWDCLANAMSNYAPPDIVRLFLDKGASVDKKENRNNPFPWTWQRPLHIAVDHGDVQSVKMLLGAGADINFEDYMKHTPLIVALQRTSDYGFPQKNYYELVDYLVMHPNLDAKWANRQTYITAICYFFAQKPALCIKYIDHLVGKGAPVRTPAGIHNNVWDTLFRSRWSDPHSDVIRDLLRHGFDPYEFCYRDWSNYAKHSYAPSGLISFIRIVPLFLVLKGPGSPFKRLPPDLFRLVYALIL